MDRLLLWSAGTDDDGYVLCLMHNENCISSIQVEPDAAVSTMLEMNSFTNPSYESRKYNKLLRFVLIFIADAIMCPGENKQRFTTISSHAVNPISAWLLMGYFDYYLQDADDPNLTSTWQNKRNLKDAIWTHKYSCFEITIPLHRKNIDQAMNLISDLIHGDLKCP